MWKTGGEAASMTDYRENTERTRFNGSCGGDCGWCFPFPELYLGVNPANSKVNVWRRIEWLIG